MEGVREMSTVVLASLNTAVERLLIAPNFRVGEVNDLDEDHLLPGGKGVNTARILAGLRALGDGVPALNGHLCGFLGGASGELVAAGLAESGIDGTWQRTMARTRFSEILVDPDDPARATVFNGRGEQVSIEELTALDERYVGRIAEAVGVVCSGSTPPGVRPDVYAQWIRHAHDAGKWSLLDARGPVFTAAIEAVPSIVKINRDELTAITTDTTTQINDWLELGVTTVIITDGSQPLHAITPSGTAEVVPPTVQTRSGVGSGDAFTAGLVAALEESAWQGWDAALRLASACGAANAMNLRAGLPSGFAASDLRKLADRTTVTWR